MSGVPKNALGFCLRTTMSPGCGAISETISLPLSQVLLISSVDRLFFACQRPKATLLERSSWPGVKCRQMFFPRFGEQFANVMYALPSFGPAAVAKAFDRFENRLRLVADKVVIHVNDKNSRPLAEARPLAVAREGKYFVVTRR